MAKTYIEKLDINNLKVGDIILTPRDRHPDYFLVCYIDETREMFIGYYTNWYPRWFRKFKFYNQINYYVDKRPRYMRLFGIGLDLKKYKARK